jgi:two-component sensor histidine kinase
MIERPAYIKEFVGFTSYLNDKSNPVIVNYDFDEIYLTTKQAIPLALAINELITNSYKYAFKDNPNPKLNISLKQEGDDITMIFSDNGKGVPPELDITKSKSLGFKLIFIFIKQLKGNYVISNEKGFSIIVKFKYSEN